MKFSNLRRQYHRMLCEQVIRANAGPESNGYPNFADGSSKSSKDIAWSIIEQLHCTVKVEQLPPQTIGKRFENITLDFLEHALRDLYHLRPGQWEYAVQSSISSFAQYEHLADLERIIQSNHTLASALGKDYIVKPDIVVGRRPVSDKKINERETLVNRNDHVAQWTPLRAVNQSKPLLHASISCKWTIRSDRSQNTRTEALNLIRNRKGHLPHIVAVTAEPLPTRLAALALGTGDLDCVYHFALPELITALSILENEDQRDMLDTLINGKRLRDISDLPFDLAV